MASPSGHHDGLISPWVRLRSASLHPFIYQRMIGEADPGARPGDVVNVYDKRGALFGRGMYNPRSQIALRMLAHGDEAIDEGFWRGRIRRAVELRRRLGLEGVTDAYRVVHAEGDGLSGLIVERYADWVAVEVFSLGIHQRMEMLAGLVQDELGPPTSLDRPGRGAGEWRTVVRADRRVEEIEGFRVAAAAEGAVREAVVREHGVRYRVDLAQGHKTGFFCDQRDNRRRFAELCRGARVLDLCCYTGGFGLCARLAGGAREVTCVDLDEAAVAGARENANLNQARVETVHADAFTYMRQMLANGREYDAVVLDPPKLATTREGVGEGLRKYHDLNQLAVRLVSPGGLLLTCSCSGLVSREAFNDAVLRAGLRAGRLLQILGETGAGGDHPVMSNCPESAYLKALWLRVLER